MEYVVILLVCGTGSFLNVLCGFGLGSMSIMFLPYVMQSTTAPASMVNIITVWQAAGLGWRYRSHIQWKTILPALVGYFIASAIAVRLSTRVDFHVMTRVLGVFLLGLSAYLAFFSDKLHLRPTVKNGLLCGLIGGFSSGLFGIGGPPATLYFSSTTDDKETYLANLECFYLISNAYAVVMRIINGIITRHLLVCAAVGMAAMALGSVLGNRIFQKVNERFILLSIYAMMAVSGVVMLFT